MKVNLAEFDLDERCHQLVEPALADIALMHVSRTYHNLYHTVSVMRWVNALAKFYGMDKRARSLTILPPALHDYVYGIAPVQNEIASAEHLRHSMEASHNFEEDEIEIASDGPIGTILDCVDGKLLQRARHSKHLSTHITADADLSDLGSPFEKLYAGTLALLEEGSPGASPRGHEMHKLLGNTLSLLEQPPLTEAAEIMLPHRQENHERILYLRSEIGQELGYAA